jgi:D-aspartate ligase
LKYAIVIFNHVVGLGVIRALGKKNVSIVALYYSDCEMGQFSRYIKERIKVPDPRISETDFINKLDDLSSKFNGSLLIPTDDYSVIVLSKNKQKLQKSYIVGVMDWDIIRKIIYKHEVYEFASSIGVACPKTFLPKTISDLTLELNNISYPCLIKPLEGHIFFDQFGEKMFKIQTKDELLSKFNLVQQLGLNVMVQEIIPGDDGQGVNYNSYFIDGEPVAEFTAKKVRIEPPFFGSPRVLVSKNIPEIYESGRRLLRNLKYEGFSCMEFKKDVRDDTYKLMEINTRNNLTTSLAVKCGMNFPWIMYRHLLFGEVNQYSGFKNNVYWIDISHDVMRFFTSRKEEGYNIKEYFNPYFSKKVFAIFNFFDPLPFIKRLHYFFSLTIQKLGNIVRSKFSNQITVVTHVHSEHLNSNQR